MPLPGKSTGTVEGEASARSSSAICTSFIAPLVSAAQALAAEIGGFAQPITTNVPYRCDRELHQHQWTTTLPKRDLHHRSSTQQVMQQAGQGSVSPGSVIPPPLASTTIDNDTSATANAISTESASSTTADIETDIYATTTDPMSPTDASSSPDIIDSTDAPASTTSPT